MSRQGCYPVPAGDLANAFLFARLLRQATLRKSEAAAGAHFS